MPYISKDARLRIDNGGKPENAGELNYSITKLIDAYLIQKGKLQYQQINEVIGVLECSKLELYRRIVAQYEDKKISENGDVYTTELAG